VFPALALSGSDYVAPWFARAAARIACIETLRGGRNGRSNLIHSLAFGKFGKAFKNARTDFDWLSRDAAYVDKYVADPQCGYRMANGYWRDLLNTLADIYTPSNMKKIAKDLPLYIFSGDKDPCRANGQGRSRYWPSATPRPAEPRSRSSCTPKPVIAASLKPMPPKCVMTCWAG
jgi:alpha-beta hydrolase superfamily lysophospholipase